MPDLSLRERIAFERNVFEPESPMHAGYESARRDMLIVANQYERDLVARIEGMRPPYYYISHEQYSAGYNTGVADALGVMTGRIKDAPVVKESLTAAPRDERPARDVCDACKAHYHAYHSKNDGNCTFSLPGNKRCKCPTIQALIRKAHTGPEAFEDETVFNGIANAIAEGFDRVVRALEGRK